MDGFVSSSKSMLVCTKLRDYVTAKNLVEHFTSVHNFTFTVPTSDSSVCVDTRGQREYSEQCFYVSLQGLPGLDKSGSGPNTPRGILATHGPMSPESFKLMHRHRSATRRDFFKVPVRLSCFNLIQLHPDTLLSLHHHVIKTSFRVSKHVEKVLKNPQSQFPLSLHRGSGQRGTDQERQSS